MGSWGPKEIDKETNDPYGLNFPVITIRDMVKAQETFRHLDKKNFVLREVRWVECSYCFVQHFK